MLELSLLLPMFVFILVASTDFARVYHDCVTINDCSRNGALYGCVNSSHSNATYQSGVAASALADANGLRPSPTVTTATGSLGQGNQYIDVTVSYNFKTLVNYPGIPSTVPLSATTRMRVVPSSYRMQ